MSHQLISAKVVLTLRAADENTNLCRSFDTAHTEAENNITNKVRPADSILEKMKKSLSEMKDQKETVRMNLREIKAYSLEALTSLLLSEDDKKLLRGNDLVKNLEKAYDERKRKYEKILQKSKSIK